VTQTDSSLSDPLYLAIDQGGHATRAWVFNRHGRTIARGQVNVATARPRPGWVEQDPEEMVRSVRTAVELAVQRTGASASAIAAAGLATQRSAVVCWDPAAGEALSPILSWQDRRAHKWLGGFANQAEHIHRTTGLFLSAHYGASKLRWCLDHLPPVAAANRNRRLAWGPLASFLIFRLLEERPLLVDPANAARTLLWNIKTRDWDPGLLKLFALPAAPLPRCVPSRYPFGRLRVGKRAIPLQILTGDQSAALFAFGRPGAATAYVNVGTGAFIQLLRDRYPGHAPDLLAGVVYQDESAVTYVLEGTVNGAGSALHWIEEELHIEETKIEAQLPTWLARATVPPLFLNGVGGLGSPFWRPDFPSRFVGRGGDWEKVVAVVESIVFLLHVNLGNMMQSSPAAARITITGGLAVLDGLCQRLADLSGLPVYRPLEREATARGTAYLVAGCPEAWPETEPGVWFNPQSNPALQARYHHWHKALLDALST